MDPSDAAATSPLFEGLSKVELQDLLALGAERSLGAGDALFEEGEPAGGLALLVEGRVEVRRHGDGTGVVLAELGPGQVVGEIGLLDDAPRTASVRALAPCRFLVLDRHGFEEMLESLDPTACRVLRNLARLLAQRLRSTDERLTASLTGNEESPPGS